jgi:hypothetical protein
MVLIEFTNGADWCVANWVFRRFAADILAVFPDDDALRSILERAGCVGGVDLNHEEPSRTLHLMNAMKITARRAVAAAVGGTAPADLDDGALYVGALQDLLGLLEHV